MENPFPPLDDLTLTCRYSPPDAITIEDETDGNVVITVFERRVSCVTLDKSDIERIRAWCDVWLSNQVVR